MTERTILNPKIPTTQTPQAVAALLKFYKRPSEPMPSFVELSGGVRLTRSKRGDCYYTTTPKTCSCKARTFNPGKPCKHMLALQAAREEQQSTAKPAAIKQPNAGSWHGHNGPIAPEETRAVKVSASPLYVDCHDTTDRDAAYHSIKSDREMWPAEA